MFQILQPDDCFKIDEYRNMVECFSKNAQKVDKELNIVYQNTLKTANQPDNKQSNPNGYKFIKQNQRDWLKFVTEYCDARSISANDPNQGSYYPTAVNSCFTDLSIERIQQLKNFKCEEGDMSSTYLFY